MISLTASGPSWPFESIILVVAIFKESLKRVTISIRVGNVVRSVGLGTYKDIINIRTESAKDIVRKKSSKPLGRGTIMIASIAITKKTIVKSLDFAIGARNLNALACMPILLSLANSILKTCCMSG
jgi:hypothetical protein